MGYIFSIFFYMLPLKQNTLYDLLDFSAQSANICILRAKISTILNKGKTETYILLTQLGGEAEMTISFCAFRRHQSRVNPFAIDVPNRSAFQMFQSRRSRFKNSFRRPHFVSLPCILFIAREIHLGRNLHTCVSGFLPAIDEMSEI